MRAWVRIPPLTKLLTPTPPTLTYPAMTTDQSRFSLTPYFVTFEGLVYHDDDDDGDEDGMRVCVYE